ncbi:MAG: hypothetical protein WCT46_01340, partial [Candidatus Gracilibacteria bacterium]
ELSKPRAKCLVWLSALKDDIRSRIESYKRNKKIAECIQVLNAALDGMIRVTVDPNYGVIFFTFIGEHTPQELIEGITLPSGMRFRKNPAGNGFLLEKTTPPEGYVEDILRIVTLQEWSRSNDGCIPREEINTAIKDGYDQRRLDTTVILSSPSCSRDGNDDIEAFKTILVEITTKLGA